MSAFIATRHGSPRLACEKPIRFLPLCSFPQPATSATASTRAPPRRITLGSAATLEPDGEKNDDALENELKIGIDVVEPHDVVDDADGEHPRQRAHHTTRPTGERRPSDDNGGNRVELIRYTVVRISLLQLRAVHEPSERRQKTRDDVHHRFMPADSHSRESRRRLVVADRVQVATTTSPREKEIHRTRRQREDQSRRRDKWDDWSGQRVHRLRRTACAKAERNRATAAEIPRCAAGSAHGNGKDPRFCYLTEYVGKIAEVEKDWVPSARW